MQALAQELKELTVDLAVVLSASTLFVGLGVGVAALLS